MATFNISNFRSTVLGKGLARPNRFEVLFNVPKGIRIEPTYRTVYNPPNTSIFQQIGNVLGTVGAIGGIIKNKGLGSLIATNAISILTSAQKDRPINLSDDRKVCLLCESTNFPPLNIISKPQRIFGPAYQRPITSEYGGEGIAMTFHVDREMVVKKLFDAWMQTIVRPDTFTVAFPEEYVCDIIINQLDEFDNVSYSLVLEDAFPRSMNMLDLNNSTQNQTHRLTVLFSFRKWRTEAPRT